MPARPIVVCENEPTIKGLGLIRLVSDATWITWLGQTGQHWKLADARRRAAYLYDNVSRPAVLLCCGMRVAGAFRDLVPRIPNLGEIERMSMDTWMIRLPKLRCNPQWQNEELIQECARRVKEALCSL